MLQDVGTRWAGALGVGGINVLSRAIKLKRSVVLL